MEQIYAHFNHGRWIAFCPKCNTASVVTPNSPMVCAGEYPNLLAKTLVPNPHMAGAFNSVPDEFLRREARQAALDAGEAYEVIFPAEKAEIEKILRARPVHGRNWFPGVSLSELIEENARVLK